MFLLQCVKEEQRHRINKFKFLSTIIAEFLSRHSITIDKPTGCFTLGDFSSQAISFMAMTDIVDSLSHATAKNHARNDGGFDISPFL